MSDQASPYDAVLTDLRAKREQIDQAIQILEALRDGVTVPGVGVPSARGASTVLAGGPDRSGGGIAAGTFHGMSIEAATKKLLQMCKRTMGAQEITTNLREGGLHLQSESPANTVTSVLTRAFNSGGDIVRVSRGVWGLQEWYPNQRFGRKGTAED